MCGFLGGNTMIREEQINNLKRKRKTGMKNNFQ